MKGMVLESDLFFILFIVVYVNTDRLREMTGN